MKVENVKVYADPPVTENRISQDGITALQVTTVGVVPTKEGELVLPEIRIPWWNTQTDREEIAIIPASTYQVLPALNAAASAPTVTVPLSDLNQPTFIAEPANPYWQWAAIAFGFLWLLSTWQWLMLRRQVRVLESANTTRFETAVFSDPDESREFGELKKACTRNRAADAHRQLFLWGKARFPEIQSVLDLSKKDDALAEEITRLEAHLYGDGDKDSWCGDDILKTATKLRKQKAEKQKDSIAMNAVAKYVLLAVAIPSHLSKADIKNLHKGFDKAAQEFGIEIIGGDTVSNNKIDITVTVLAKSKRPLRRVGLKRGHLLAHQKSVSLRRIVF